MNVQSCTVVWILLASTVPQAQFGDPETYPAGVHPTALEVGRIDADERPDLVVVNPTTQEVRVLRNLGDAKFETSAVADVPLSPEHLRLRDWDGDDRLDVFVCGKLMEGMGAVFLLPNDGLGSLGDPVAITSSGVQQYVTDFLFVRLDGDRAWDLILASHAPSSSSSYTSATESGFLNLSRISSLIRDPTREVFALPVPWRVRHYLTGESPHTDAPNRLALADFDGDGDQDFVASFSDPTGSRSSELRAYLNAGIYPAMHGEWGGVYTFPSVRFAVPMGPADVFARDLNGDGYADVAVLCKASRMVMVYRNAGGIGLDWQGFVDPVEVPLGMVPDGMCLADVGEDGLEELVVVGSKWSDGPSIDDGVLMIFPNLSEEGEAIVFGPHSARVLPSGLVPTDVVVADLNGDQAVDCAVTLAPAYDPTALRRTGEVAILLGTPTPGTCPETLVCQIEHYTYPPEQKIVTPDSDSDKDLYYPDVLSTDDATGEVKIVYVQDPGIGEHPQAVHIREHALPLKTYSGIDQTSLEVDLEAPFTAPPEHMEIEARIGVEGSENTGTTIFLQEAETGTWVQVGGDFPASFAFQSISIEDVPSPASFVDTDGKIHCRIVHESTHPFIAHHDQLIVRICK